MIDPAVDPSFAALERDQARREAARARATRPRRAAPAGALTTLPSDPSAISSFGTLSVETTKASAEVQTLTSEEAPHEPSDPLSHLRASRQGLAAVVVLVLVLLWSRLVRPSSTSKP